MIDPVLILFGVLFVALPTVILLAVVYARLSKTANTPWRLTHGEIEESALLHDFDSMPYLAVRYKFFISEQPYWGNQEFSCLPNSEVDEYKHKYPVGRKIPVSYQPDDPEYHSAIGTQTKSKNWSVKTRADVIRLVAFFVVFYAVGVVLLYAGFNPSPKWSSTIIEVFN